MDGSRHYFKAIKYFFYDITSVSLSFLALEPEVRNRPSSYQ